MNEEQDRQTEDDSDQSQTPDEGMDSNFGQPIQNEEQNSLVQHQLRKAQQREGGFNRAREAGQEAKDQARKFLADKARMAAIQAIRSAAVAAWSWISAAIGPYAAIIIIVILLIVILSGPALAFWNRATKGAWGTQQSAYASFNNPADSAMLREFFSNVKGGDPAKLKSNAEAVKSKVAEGKLKFRDNAKATQLLDEMIRLCDEALSAGGALNQKRIMEIRAELIDLFDDDNPIGLAGRFANPFPSNNKITGWGGNLLHGRSAQRPQDDSGHNVFNGFSQPGTGDAADLSGEIGTPMLAMFSGTTSEPPVTGVTKPREHCLILKSDDSDNSYTNKIEAWYCHVSNKKIGHFNVGDQIATLGKGTIGHVHLEIWVDGKSIHTTAADINGGQHKDEVAKYMWEHIQLAFGI